MVVDIQGAPMDRLVVFNGDICAKLNKRSGRDGWWLCGVVTNDNIRYPLVMVKCGCQCNS